MNIYITLLCNLFIKYINIKASYLVSFLFKSNKLKFVSVQLTSGIFTLINKSGKSLAGILYC